MTIGIYFNNHYDMVDTARKINELGLRCRIDVNTVNKEYDNYDFILRFLDKDMSILEKTLDDVRIIYSGKELFSSPKIIEDIKNIKGEKEKVIFFMGDRSRGVSVLGGYIIFLSSKGEGNDYLYLPEYMKGIWKKEEIVLISKGSTINSNYKKGQGIIFDCQCKRDILELIKEYDISLKENIFVGDFDLIEAIYSRAMEHQRNMGNYIIVSSSKNPEELSLMREIIQGGNVESYCLNPYTLLVNPKEEKDRAISYLTHKLGIKNICLSTANNPEDVINLNELAIVLNISVEEIKKRIDEELIETASTLINCFEGINVVVSFKAAVAFSLAKVLGLRGLHYKKEVTSKWTCISGELEERKIDLLINVKDGEGELSLQELLSRYFIMS
ncbi:MAG: hypothetical protein ACI33K_03650 [Clostridiaceae bacterium]